MYQRNAKGVKEHAKNFQDQVNHMFTNQTLLSALQSINFVVFKYLSIFF